MSSFEVGIAVNRCMIARFSLMPNVDLSQKVRGTICRFDGIQRVFGQSAQAVVVVLENGVPMSNDAIHRRIDGRNYRHVIGLDRAIVEKMLQSAGSKLFRNRHD